MNDLVWITDWRNRARFSKFERQRECRVASVSPDWGIAPPSKPLVFAEIHLIGTAPCYVEVDGIASNTGWNRDVRDWARGYGYDLMPDGQRFVLWESGDHRQKSYAINMADASVASEFAQRLVTEFPWANGWHFDYYSNIAWLAAEQNKSYASDPAWWAAWDTGLMEAVAMVRKLRPQWFVVGQQYHLTNATPPLNGLFIEEYPTRSGMTLAQHAEDKETMSANGLPPLWCAEIRNPQYYNTSTIEGWKAWAVHNGIYVSMGRNERAVYW